MALSNAPAKPRPPAPFADRLRRCLITLHRVVGLTAGLLLSLLGLTGSLLVFRHEIEGLTEPALYRVHPASTNPASLESVVAAVRSAEPDREIRHLFLAETAHSAHEVWLAGTEERVYVDPYTARILGTRDSSRSLTGWLFALHTKLLAGETGEKIAGWGGVALLALSVTGIILWWPSHLRQLSDRLRVKWDAGVSRANFDLHRVGGFYAAGLLALLALTGTALVFDDIFQDLASRLTRSVAPPPRPTVTPRPGQTLAPLSLMLSQTDRALPGGRFRRVSFPAKPGAAVVIRKQLPGDMHPNGMSYVYLDPYTAAVLRVDRADEASPGQHLMNLRYPLHIGRWGGFITQCVHAAIGLMPSLLFITGCRIWWKRTWGKRRITAVSLPK